MVGGVEEVRGEVVGECPPGLGGFGFARLPQSLRLQGSSSGRWGARAAGKARFCQSFASGGCEDGCNEYVHPNRYEVLKEDDEETVYINAVVQEVVQVTVDSGAARSVCPMKRKGVVRSKGVKKVKLAAANGSPIHVEGEVTLNFSRGGKRCAMKFLDADVKRPLAAVSAIVDEGNTVVFSTRGAYIENDLTKEKIPMVRRNGVFILELEAEKVVAKAGMDAGAVVGEGPEEGEDMVFRGRLDEEGMGFFRRRA